IKIEPKTSFGTGHHESTQLAAGAMIDLRRKIHGQKVIDIGTGTGILCFLADRLGAGFCLGLDNDRECRANMAENRDDNQLQNPGSLLIGSLESLKKSVAFDVAVMNIIRTLSAPLLKPCYDITSSSGKCIWTGLMADEKGLAHKLSLDAGWTITRERILNGWWCGVLEKSNNSG
ncbi:50S ribosomal protein L11 methyltransferase, partial [Fibrobacterota bacterium]